MRSRCSSSFAGSNDAPMNPARCHPKWPPWAKALTPMPVATAAMIVAIAARRKNWRRGFSSLDPEGCEV